MVGLKYRHLDQPWDMNRRDFVRNAGLATAGALVGLNALAASEVKLIILHTNDTHSRLDPFPDDGRKWGGLGGVARRATLVDAIRKQHKNVLLLDSGDIVQGTPYFNFFKGEPEIMAMNQMGYDFATLGNHDFDNGVDGLRKLIDWAQFPFLVANYDLAAEQLSNRVLPYKVVEKQGVKIGIFGLGIEFAGLVLPQAHGRITYQDPLPVAKDMVKHLKQTLGCAYVICLSHLGLKYESNKVSDLVLARQTPGLDLILGGHTHSFLEKPEVVIHPDKSQTIVNQVGWAGIWLGQVEVTFSAVSPPKTLVASPLVVSQA